MTATDLRIGNLINFPFIGSDVVVVGLALPSVGDVRIQTKINNNSFFELPEKYKPIPLTEEWLLKFGLKSELNGYYYIDDFVISLDGYVYFGIEEKYIRSIQFVHDLQNLYYALTNEELTYDPN